MKIIKIDLSKQQQSELKQLQRRFGDYRSERALAVLHCSEGMKATEIAHILKRQINTICNWLNAFLEHGIEGLSRKYSTGRPSQRNTKLIPKIEEYLENSPKDYGLGEMLWTVNTLRVQYERDTGKSVSEDTVRRALHDAGYSSKRSKKTPPYNAPSKEEKLKRVQEIIKEIGELSFQEDVEVMFIDESHFSTEPYVIRGWSKKGEHFSPADSKKTRKLYHIWCIRTATRCFLLEECE